MRYLPIRERFPTGRKVKKTTEILSHVRNLLSVRGYEAEEFEIEALAICYAGVCDPYPTPYVWVYVYSPSLYGGITSVCIEDEAIEDIQLEEL